MTDRSRAALAALIVGAWALPRAGAAAAPLLTDGCSAYAPETAQRSGLPVEVIVRVMRAESGGNPRALSPKGAMGCMQIMPSTWTYLTARYRLGADPFDARMNMIGGALYLAELANAYGWPGAFAAYNAGPNRYVRFTAGGAALPAETAAYMTRLAGIREASATTVMPPRWQEARLFLVRATTERTAPTAAPASIPASSVGGRVGNPLFPLAGSGTGAGASRVGR